MSVSVAPLVVSLVLTNRIRRYFRVNRLPQWEKPLKFALYFSVFLFATEVIFSSNVITKWIWHIYLVALIIFSLQQLELRLLRMFTLAFVPYEIICLLSDLTQALASGFYDTNENYFKNSLALTYIWMAAILFSHNRQFKAAEKERIKREHEDELNRAIAIRKTELEGLVAERTAELTTQKEELEHTLDELRTTQTQLIHSEKMASLGQLTAGIAHEIQNPINFVNNFSEVNKELIEEMQLELDKGNLIEAKEISKDIQVNEQKINFHGKRADSIVKGMLQHSRSSSSIKEPTNINKLADEYLRLAYHGLRAKDKSFNATLKTDYDETVGYINIIPQDIGRVILNLVTNAFYAVTEKKRASDVEGDLEGFENLQGLSPYEPTVTVTTSHSLSSGEGRGEVRISVKDNGNGIPPSVLDKIFNPFFTTKPSGQGTGLGLSLSYDIVKAHGGELKVETKEGAGATFIILLNL